MPYSQIMTAHYRAEVEADFVGSPFVEALPPMADVKELGTRLSCIPDVDSDWKNAGRLTRINKLSLLSDHLIFVSLARHVDVAFKFQDLLYKGYLFRGHPGWKKGHAEVEADKAAQARGSASAIPRVIRGGAFLGPSGSGKTTTIDRCCAMYPQIIHHGEHGGENFTKTQLVYLRAQCTETASEKGVVGEIFAGFDEHLGTSDQDRYSSTRHTLNSMMVGLAKRCRENAVGMIILDEIEMLKKFAAEPQQIAKFLTRLSNVTRVPILKLGLPEASELLSADMYQARRSMGFREWDYFSPAEWQLFVAELFKMYLLREEPKWAVISEVLYDLTHGVPDIAIQLFKLAQIDCLTFKEELITPARLATVLEREGALLKDVLDIVERKRKRGNARPPRSDRRDEPPDPSGDIQAPGEPS